MAQPPVPTDFFEWLIVGKADSASEIRDWYNEYVSFCNSIDADVKQNRIPTVFKSNTTPVTLEDKDSGSLIISDTLASQTYNLPLIVPGSSVGMRFLIVSDSVSETIVLQAAGSDQFYLSGVAQGQTFNVTNSVTSIVASDSGIWTLNPDLPTHANSHENGGVDEIDVTGLSGLLADQQTPLPHMTTHRQGETDEYLDSVTTVNSATYTVLSTDRVLLVTYTNTAPVTVSIPSSLRTKSGFRITIKDFGIATVNNITIEDDTGTLFIINSTGTSAEFISNGTYVIGPM